MILLAHENSVWVPSTGSFTNSGPSNKECDSQLEVISSSLLLTLSACRLALVPFTSSTTGTMGAAHFENWTGEIIPLLCNFSNSCSTFSLSASGTGCSMKNLEVEFGQHLVLLSIPFRHPNSSVNIEEYFASTSSSDLSSSTITH